MKAKAAGVLGQPIAQMAKPVTDNPVLVRKMHWRTDLKHFKQCTILGNAPKQDCQLLVMDFLTPGTSQPAITALPQTGYLAPAMRQGIRA